MLNATFPVNYLSTLYLKFKYYLKVVLTMFILCTVIVFIRTLSRSDVIQNWKFSYTQREFLKTRFSRCMCRDWYRLKRVPRKGMHHIFSKLVNVA